MSRKKILKNEDLTNFIPETIGDRVNVILASHNLNGAKFSDLCEISTGNLNSIINDDSKPSAKTLTQILEKFNVNINWLLSGHGEMLLPPKTSNNVVDIKHQDVIKQFKDPEKALGINRNLVDIEAADPEEYGYVRGIVQEVHRKVAEKIKKQEASS